MPFFQTAASASVQIFESRTESNAKVNISVHNMLLIFYQLCNLVDQNEQHKLNTVLN